MTDPQNPQPQNPQPQNPDPATVGGPTDGDIPGGIPSMSTLAQLYEEQDRGMDYALDSVDQLTLDLSVWLTDIDSDGSGRGQDASDRSRLLGCMIDQLCTMSTLVGLSLRQRRVQGDPTTAWVLLEQARQQLGWAARTAGARRGSVVAKAGIVSEPEEDAMLEDEEPPATALVLEYLLQRDLIPRPEYAAELMDMGEGIGVIPDPRPETPFELVPLQMLSAAVMRCGSVIADAMPRQIVDRMAYGTYVATLLEEVAGLLEEHSVGQPQLRRLAGIAQEAADMVWQLTPGPLEAFPPREDGSAA